MYRKQVRRRRAVLVGLIVASLVLLSLHFSEPESGPLHGVSSGVATVLSPLEGVASEALKPGRDLVNWFDETFEARGENEDLAAELARTRGELAAAQAALGENDELRRLLRLDRGEIVAQFDPVTARVIGRSPTVWYSTVTIDAGSGDDVEVNDSVIAADGLVGRVTSVTGGSAQVQLITDPRNAVSAKVLPDGPQGIVEPQAGDPDDLLLDFIDNDQVVQEDQFVVTAGWSDGRLSSAYPYGLEIGRVTEASTGERESFQRIRVTPFVDMRELETLQVLTGGPERPGVPR